jgi:hypothetical protein
MKWPLLLAVRVYWWLWPPQYRRSCIYRISCAQHVYSVTYDYGLFAGSAALYHRWRTCRPGYQFAANRDGEIGIRLHNGQMLSADQIAREVLAPVQQRAVAIAERLAADEQRKSASASGA